MDLGGAAGRDEIVENSQLECRCRERDFSPQRVQLIELESIHVDKVCDSVVGGIERGERYIGSRITIVYGVLVTERKY